MGSPNENVKFLLNWNHFSDHVSNCLARLMTDSSYSDIILATGDKRMIYAHKFVLANSSKYFQRLLRQMSKQKSYQLVVALPDVKYEILKILMNYMYRGETQVPHELLPTVIKVGRILEINGLIDLHEADSTARGASIWKYRKGDPQASRSLLRSPKMKDPKREPRSQSKSRSREGHSSVDPRKRSRCQNVDIDSTSEQSGSYKNGVVRRFRPILPKNEASPRDCKKDVIQLPLKRKFTRKDQEKESPSSSTENSGSKKLIIEPENTVINIKREKPDDISWEMESQPEQEITIKTEVPFELEDINYTELVCDYCNESYASPSDWVRHMTEHHGDRGYQSHREVEKEGMNERMYTCIICKAATLSAAELIQHITIWHTESDLTEANNTGNQGAREEDPTEIQIKTEYVP